MSKYNFAVGILNKRNKQEAYDIANAYISFENDVDELSSSLWSKIQT